MKIGKLPNEILDKLILKPIKEKNPPIKEVLAGPSIGEDCALLDFEGDDILVSTDPITATEDNIGRLLVTVCTNDVAASGGKPVGIMVTALIPPHADEKSLKKVMEDLLDEAEKQNIAVLGGHTEITDAVNRIVLSGTVLGRVEKGGCLKTGGAKTKDKIVMTKSAGLEGAAILAEEFSEPLTGRFGHEFVEKVKKYAEMTSVIKDAGIAKKLGASSMHDITEGGVLGALSEASRACGLSFEVDLRKANVSREVHEICGFFDINPFELISSGSLLITVKDGDKLVKELEKSGIPASVIGEVANEGEESYAIDLDGERKLIIPPDADAIYDAMKYSHENPVAKTVTFVCTGNTCRSPMAEALAKKLGYSRYSFVSRGLYAENGAAASENSIKAMSEKGIDLSSFKSTAFTESDAKDSFLILTMTKSHKRAILELYPNIEYINEKVFTIQEYAFEKNDHNDISDPFGLDAEAYRACAADIEKCVRLILNRLA